jgi:hypothetical protein
MEKNPYAAPRAAVDDVTPEKRGRPVLVWIITIVMAIGVAGGLATSVAALLGSPIGGPAAAEQMKGMGRLDYIWTLALTLVSVVPYVDLFRLKRRALPFLVALFVVSAVVLCGNLAFRPEYRAMFEQPGGYWGLLAGWVVNLAVIGYVWRLRVKGVLQ